MFRTFITRFLTFFLVFMMAACVRDEETTQAACLRNDQNTIVVEGAWVRPAVGRPMTAAYFTLCNAGDSEDALTSVSGDIGNIFEIHRSSMNTEGVMSMAQVDSIALPPGQRIVLEPGGAHVMVIGLAEAIKPGSKTALTLHFRNAAPMEILAEARP